MTDLEKAAIIATNEWQFAIIQGVTWWFKREGVSIRFVREKPDDS